jgi:cysteine-rich repeat protein
MLDTPEPGADVPMDVPPPDADTPDTEAPDAEAPDADAPDADAPDADAPDADAALPDADLPDGAAPDAMPNDGATPPLCPGAIAVIDCSSGTLNGNTAGRPDSFASYTCGPGNYAGSDAVYVFQNATAADVTLTAYRGIPSGAFDLMVLDGSGACNTSSPCVTANRTSRRTQDVRFSAGAGERFYVAYDIFNNPSLTTDFTLQVECRPIVCGNGRVAGTEQCDDGNTVGGDGCSSTCQRESTPFTVPAVGGKTEIAGRLAASDAQWSRPNPSCFFEAGGASMPFHTYRIRNTDSELHLITVTASWAGDGFLAIYDTRFNPAMPGQGCVAANDDAQPTTSQVEEHAIAPGEELIVVLTEHARGTALGPYRLSIETTY